MMRLLKAVSVFASLLLIASTVNAGTVALPYTNHMDSASGITGTAYSSPAPDFIADATSPDASMSYRWTFPAGYSGANSPAIMGVSFTGQNEIYVQYYFKYSANWTWSGIGQKHIYIWMGSTGGYNFYTGTGMWDSSSPSFYVNFQAPGGSGTIQASTNINTQKDRWYKVVLRCVVNTGSNSDGTIQVWMDDGLILNRSNIRFKNPGAAFTKLDFTPVWGGDFNVPSTSYLYFDYLRIQTAAFGGGGGDVTAPYASQWSPAKSSTGVAVSNRTISFHIQDDVDVLTSYGTVTIEGTPYTCAAGLTCTGSSTDKTITYTKGSDWAADTVVNVSTSGFRDTAGNTMATDTWQYTIESAAPEAPTITTSSPLTTRTQGTSFSESFTATGGTSPYTWSVVSGSLPSGTTLSSGGVFSGTPSASGPYNFTVKIVDAVASEDNQALAIVVNPATPGGQSTVNVTSIADTFINSGAAGTNYSDNTYVEAYQYPIGTVANRILDNVPVSLPDNVSIVSARLYMYVSSHDGSGGTDPMRVYAYRSDAITPSTATWTNSSSVTKQAYESVTEVSLTAGWVSWNIATMAAWAYANDSPLYIALDGGGDGASDTNRIFTSVDGAEGYRPFVSITYMQLVAPEGPSISAPGKMRVSKLRGSFR